MAAARSMYCIMHAVQLLSDNLPETPAPEFSRTAGADKKEDGDCLHQWYSVS